MIKKIIYFYTILISSAALFAGDETPPNPSQLQSPTDCYTLQEELGEGAFGKVWAATNSQGQRVAIKSYKSHDNPAKAESLLADAEREFHRGQQLSHPNIVKTIELFKDTSDSGCPTRYLVLELVEGKTLFWTPKKSLSNEASLKTCAQLIDALRYALSHQLIYLDMHANNLMLTSSRDIMIIDLASFFSFDELLNFVKQRDEGSPAKKIHNKKDDLRQKKLEQFFQENPKLLSSLQETIRVSKKSKSSFGTEESPNKIFLPLFSYFFNNLSEVCLHTINKSDIDRETKIDLFVAIKKLAWNYLADSDEHINVSIDSYLDQLGIVLSF